MEEPPAYPRKLFFTGTYLQHLTGLILNFLIVNNIIITFKSLMGGLAGIFNIFSVAKIVIGFLC